MPGKDDLFANRTLWLDADHMAIARERFYARYCESIGRHPDPSRSAEAERRHEYWTVAWAAAVAAFSFLQEGNLGPRGDTQPESAVDSD